MMMLNITVCVFQDFIKYWDQLEICHLSSKSFDDENPHGWAMEAFHGKLYR